VGRLGPVPRFQYRERDREPTQAASLAGVVLACGSEVDAAELRTCIAASFEPDPKLRQGQKLVGGVEQAVPPAQRVTDASSEADRVAAAVHVGIGQAARLERMPDFEQVRRHQGPLIFIWQRLRHQVADATGSYLQQRLYEVEAVQGPQRCLIKGDACDGTKAAVTCCTAELCGSQQELLAERPWQPGCLDAVHRPLTAAGSRLDS
jgi:hypothetical protein